MTETAPKHPGIKLRTRVRTHLTRYAASKPEEAVMCAVYDRAVEAAPLDLFKHITDSRERGAGSVEDRVSSFPILAVWHWLRTDPDTSIPLLGYAFYADAVRRKIRDAAAEVEPNLARLAHVAGVLAGTSKALYGSPTEEERASARELAPKILPYLKDGVVAGRARRSKLSPVDTVTRGGFTGFRGVVNKAIEVRRAVRAFLLSDENRATPLRAVSVAAIDAETDPTVFVRPVHMTQIAQAVIGAYLAAGPDTRAQELGRRAAEVFSNGLSNALERERCIEAIDGYIARAIIEVLKSRGLPETPESTDLAARLIATATAAAHEQLATWRVP